MWRLRVPVNGLWKGRKGKTKGIELLINEGWDWESQRCTAGSFLLDLLCGNGREEKMRILEGACPQLMAEEHGKGEWMRPHGKSHGKQAGSVTDVEFEGFHMVCDTLPNPGVRRGGNSRSGSGRGPGLVREAEFCSAIPFPGEGIAHPGFLAENSQPFPVSGMWLWLPSFPCNIPRKGKSIQWLRFPFPPFPPPYPPHIPVHVPKGRNDLGELLTLCGTLCLSWGFGKIPLDLPKGARGSGIPGLQLPASSSMSLTPSPGIAPLGFGKSHLEHLEAGWGFRDAQPFPT